MLGQICSNLAFYEHIRDNKEVLKMIKLEHGDCLDIMKTIPENSVDLVLCDLPYGMLKSDSLTWDNIIPFDKLWEQYNRVAKANAAFVLFSSGLFTVDLINSNRKNFKYRLIWKKNVPTGMAQAKYQPMRYFEDICVFYRQQPTYNPIMKPREGVGKACYNYNHYCGDSNHLKLDKVKKQYDPDWVQPSNVLEFNVVPNRNGKLHPTQKPTEILEYIIKTYSNEGDTVLDNCMGSGSTGEACVNTKRNFIGIELDNTYFEKSKQRIQSLYKSDD